MKIEMKRIFTFCFMCLATVCALPVQQREVWQGDDCSPEVYHRNCGCDEELGRIYREKSKHIFPFTLNVTENYGCLNNIDTMMDIPQLEALIEQKNNNNKRSKRNIREFTNFPVAQWPTPIYYKIDGTFIDSEVKAIKEALQMWENATCLQFIEAPVNDKVSQQYLFFFRLTGINGCYSYIGRATAVVPQPIYFTASCFVGGIGYLAHEIAHSIGLFHQHQRPDRDSYVKINNGAISRGAEGNFDIIDARFIEDLGVEYDLASVMHYRATAYSVDGTQTIQTLNPLYQKVIGQRVELSFNDVHIVNKAYCQKSCENAYPLACSNGGYQDPKDCNRCRCPDGWSGMQCREVAPPVNARCGGVVYAENYPKSISSPGYKFGKYDNGAECTWLLIAPPDGRVIIHFEADFNLYAYGELCMHWVEVRLQSLIRTGPRFCGNDITKEKIISEGEKVLINFRTKSQVDDVYLRRGFKLKFYTNSTCKAQPCRNGGTCIEQGNDFICLCPYGIGGKTCQTGAVPADVGIMFDTADHSGKDWYTMQNFVKDSVSRMHYGNSRTRVGLIEFNEYASMVTSLNQYNTVDGFFGDVSALRPGNQKTNIFQALWVLSEELFTDKNGDRVLVPNFGIIITDSAFPEDVPKSVIIKRASDTRALGMQLIVVGIGPRVNRDNLLAVSGSEDNLLLLGSYFELRHSPAVNWLLARLKTLIEETFSEGVEGVNYDMPPGYETEDNTNDRGIYDKNRYGEVDIIPTTVTSTTTTTTQRTTTPTTTTPTTTTTTPTTTTTTPTTTTPTTTTPTTTTPTTTTSTTTKPTTTTTMTTTIRSTSTKPTTTTSTATTSTATTLTTTMLTTRAPVLNAQPTYCWWTSGECSVPCGGCGTKPYERWCAYDDGSRAMTFTFSVECNTQQCGTTCLVYIARLYRIPCQECCGDYQPSGNLCIRNNGSP